MQLPNLSILPQMLDMIKPANRDSITLGDLKRCKMTHVFFDTFFNLEKYLDHEQRDPFAAQRDESVSISLLIHSNFAPNYNIAFVFFRTRIGIVLRHKNMNCLYLRRMIEARYINLFINTPHTHTHTTYIHTPILTHDKYIYLLTNFYTNLYTT